MKIDEEFRHRSRHPGRDAVAGGPNSSIPRPPRSQVIGGIVWGIGSALHEESVDSTTGSAGS